MTTDEDAAPRAAGTVAKRSSRQMRFVPKFSVKSVRVGRFIIPSTYYAMLSSEDSRAQLASRPTCIMFLRDGREVEAAYKVWRFVDPLHEYDLECEEEIYSGGAAAFGRKTYRARTSAARLIPMTPTLLRRLARCVGGIGDEGELDSEMRRAWNERTGSDPCSCGTLLRAFGDRPWYSKVERAFREAFCEMYIAALSPQISSRSLVALGSDSLFAIARLAARDPIALSCWWMAPPGAASFPENVSVESAAAIAHRFGVAFDPGVVSAVAALTCPAGILGSARERGESFVAKDAFDSCVPSASVRRDLIRLGYVGLEVSNDAAERRTGMPCNRIYYGGDRRCEEDVVRLVMDIVGTGDDGECELVKPGLRWPEHGGTGSERLNADQEEAVNGALGRRFFVVPGLPGTGKSQFVARRLKSCFRRGTVLGVAFTGIAARHLHEAIGTGVTAHSVIAARSRSGVGEGGGTFRFAGRRVLIIEEASMMPLHLLRQLLLAMRGDVRRIYVFGDPDQMSPIGGGASFMEALVRRYDGTPLSRYLRFSERNADATGVFVRNLRRICEYNGGEPVASDVQRQLGYLADGVERRRPPPLEFEWSGDAASGHPFVFLAPGDSVAGTVDVARRAIAARGMDPDDAEGGFEVMVFRNDYREEFSKAWFAASRFSEGGTRPYREHGFSVGERVMFTVNCRECGVPGSAHKSAAVMNGTVGTITRVFDEAPGTDGNATADVADTDAPPSCARATRWIEIGRPAEFKVCPATYGIANVCRMPPATVAKIQGLEARLSIVIVDRYSPHWDRKKLNTACSRGKRGCIVISDMDDAALSAGMDPELPRPCPSRTVSRIVSESGLRAKNTSFWKMFPRFEEIDAATAATAEPESEPGEKRTKFWDDDGESAPELIVRLASDLIAGSASDLIIDTDSM